MKENWLMDIQLVALHLTDSFVLTRPSLYISALLLSLRSMLQMDLPHLNVLTKIDNLKNYPDLPFNLDFYTEVQSLSYLIPHLNREQASGVPGPKPPEPLATEEDMEVDVPTSKFAKLNEAIVGMVEDFALVGFETLAVEDKKSMMVLLRAIDRASGYAFGSAEGANDTVWQVAMRQDAVTMDARDVQERWLDRRDEMDEEERKAWEEEANAFARGGQEEEPAAEEWEKGKEEEEEPKEVREMRKLIKESGIKIVKRPKKS